MLRPANDSNSSSYYFLNMFKAKFTEAEFFKNLISSFQIIVEEAVFTLSDEKILFRAWDPSHVVMVNCALPQSLFEEYACDETTKICMSLPQISKVLKGARGNEPLEISVEKGDLITLRVMGEYRRVFNLSTLAVKEEEELPLPSLSFNVKLRITTSCFKRMVDDIAMISDYVRIRASENVLEFDGLGDFGNAELTLAKGSEPLLNFEVAQESVASYDANTLSDIAKVTSNCSDVVSLEFSSEIPVKLDFELPQQGKLIYYLAPRVEE